MARVVVVGGANWDRSWRVDALPDAGATVLGELVAEGAGGKGLNVAVGLARLGVEVALVAALGFDAEGDRLVAVLVDEGIGLEGVHRVAAARTGQAALLLDGGASTIVVGSGANRRLDAAMVRAGLSACGGDCELVVLQAEVGDAALEAAADWVGEQGGGAAGHLGVVLSPAPARPLPAVVWEAADTCVCNLDEAVALTAAPSSSRSADWRADRGSDHPGVAPDPEVAALALCARGPRRAVVTLGRGGAVAASDGRLVRAAASPVDAVDPTGAGDAVTATLAAAMLSGHEAGAALDLAMAAAAVQVSRHGAASAMPSAAEVDARPSRAGRVVGNTGSMRSATGGGSGG